MRADLNLAKQRLNQKNLNLVIAKSSRVLFETKAQGIRGLLEAIKKLGSDMIGSSVADRIVGRAAALLFIHSGVIAVFAVTASDDGIEVLKSYSIFNEFMRRVPRILDSKKVDVCPYEKLAAKFSNPKEAYEELRACCASKQAL